MPEEIVNVASEISVILALLASVILIKQFVDGAVGTGFHQYHVPDTLFATTFHVDPPFVEYSIFKLATPVAVQLI